MDMMSILYAVISISGMGLLFGFGLGYAGKVFHVEEDPKIGEVQEVLPGANCGGCGYAGCAAFAEAVVAGKAPITGCPVGGSEVATKVAGVMGVKAEAQERKAAYVKCAGTCEKANSKYKYEGLNDCYAVNLLGNKGHKQCMFGCLGNGTCVMACDYDAINIVDGIAVIDRDKCVSCGACVSRCPRNLIEIVPVGKEVRVACNSPDKGKDVRAACSVGCIGCRLCQKNCEFDAVKVEGNIAKIDYDKCTMCGVCVEKCPTKAIQKL